MEKINELQSWEQEMEGIFATIKGITYDAIREIDKNAPNSSQILGLLDSLGVEITVYDRTEIKRAELLDRCKLLLFDEYFTGRYNVIAQVDKEKFLYITDEQKEQLNEQQR